MLKKILATVAAALTLSATVALAATPAAPIFSVTQQLTKIGDGDIFSGDGRQLVVDGSNVYAAFDGPYGNPCIIRSVDGGLTWGPTVVLEETQVYSYPRLVVAKDPLNSTKKLVSATWTDATGNLKYAYFPDRTTGGWSTPVAIAAAVDSPQNPVMAAAPNGSIHIVYNSYDPATWSMVGQYISAASADASFSAPTPLTWGGGQIAMTADKSNNLHVAETGSGLLKYHKKAAGSSSWSTVTLDADTGDNVSIASYDASNIYVAYLTNGTTNIGVQVTATGGSSWTKRIVPLSSSARYGTHPSIAVSATKVLAVAAFSREPYNLSINKSSDNGATWSLATVINAMQHGNIAFDSAGKINMISYKRAVVEDPFAIGTATDPFARAVYFTKEK